MIRRISIIVLASVVASLATLTRAEPRQDPTPPASGVKPKQDNGATGPLSEEEFKALHDLKEGAAPQLFGTAIELKSGAKAYLSLPKDVKAPLPGLIVIHEWWGLNDHVKHWTDRLAALGYAALAVDLYGGTVATTRDEAMKAMQSVDDAKTIAHLKSAHEFLVSDARVTAPKTASIGWCFGGKWSLRCALAIPELDGAVIYYGQLVTDVDELKKSKAPILGIFGDKDGSIPKAKVDEFDVALTKAGVAHEIHRYDAEHAFANPSGGRYDEKSAADAFLQVRKFLTTNLTPK